MNILIEPVLYTDAQTAPAAQCPHCGGTVYAPGWQCIRCERDAP